MVSRVVMPALPHLQAFTKTDFWFEDGNIILLVEDVAFKVHQGQLVRHSDVFRDMFSLPPPAADTIEGLAWVELHDDPSDVLHLLRALYDGLYFSHPTAGDFCAISAVLRTSTKYLIDHLREQCLARLESDWPTTLLGWDRREQQATVNARYNPRERFAHPVHVILLAQELRLEHILSSAFYDLARYGPRKIAHGASSPPVLLPPRPCAQDSAGEGTQPTTPAVVRLETGDLYATFVGREEGQRFLAAFIQRELVGRAVSAKCANRHHGGGHHCRESYYYVTLNLLRAVSGIATGRDADPLFSLQQAVDMLSRTDFTDGTRQCGLRICASCKEDFSLAVERARNEVWERMPGWFGLQVVGARQAQGGSAEKEKVQV